MTLLFAPPPNYQSYTQVHISDLTTWPSTSLDINTDYWIINDSPMNRDAVVIGGRDVVIMGFESNISRAGYPSGTLSGGIASAVDSTVITPVVLTAPGIADVAVGQAYVIDPFNATLAESVSVTAVTDATHFSVQRNTSVYTGLNGDNGGGPGGPAHSSGATIKRAIPIDSGYGLFVKDWTGICHIEGAKMMGDGVQQCIVVHTEHPNATLQIQNVVGKATAMDLRNFHDSHADGMQLSLGPNSLKMDKVTFTTDSNGLQFSAYNDAWSGTPWQGPPTWRLNRVNVKGTATGRHMFYSSMYDIRILPNWQHGPSPIHNFTEVYLQPPLGRVGSTIYADWDEGLNVNVPAMTVLTPPATPAGGDFVLPANVGIGYVNSEGYARSRVPTCIGMSRVGS